MVGERREGCGVSGEGNSDGERAVLEEILGGVDR